MAALDPKPQSDGASRMGSGGSVTNKHLDIDGESVPRKQNAPSNEGASRTGSGGSVTNKHLAIDVQSPSNQVQARDMKGAKLLFIKGVHEAIVKKFGNFGIILTLLAGITFMAILQPPGTFDGNGKMRSPVLIGCFLFFSTLSFLLACTGLLVVVAGTASMFRPGFYLNLDLNFKKDYIHDLATKYPGSGIPPSPKDTELDDPKVLATLVLKNLHRAWRLRVYLVFSLVSCVSAYVCGAFAIIDWAEKRNGWLLVGALGFGGVAIGVEIAKSGAGLTGFYSGKWKDTFQQLPTMAIRHPHSECVSRILRGVSTSPLPKPSNHQNMPNQPSKLQPQHGDPEAIPPRVVCVVMSTYPPP